MTQADMIARLEAFGATAVSAVTVTGAHGVEQVGAAFTRANGSVDHVSINCGQRLSPEMARAMAVAMAFPAANPAVATVAE